MEIKQAEFLISSPSVGMCPKPDKAEFAFIGRSNVGKSSLINMLCGKKELAKTSSKPGKTRLINHFIIDESWYLVDLPGYGFASVSKTALAEFEKMIQQYILERKNLIAVIVLIDARLPMQRIDSEFMHWLGENEISFAIAFTKCDKLKKKELTKNMEEYAKAMMGYWEEMPKSFITSSESKWGKDEMLNYIEENKKFFSNN